MIRSTQFPLQLKKSFYLFVTLRLNENVLEKELKTMDVTHCWKFICEAWAIFLNSIYWYVSQQAQMSYDELYIWIIVFDIKLKGLQWLSSNLYEFCAINSEILFVVIILVISK